MDFLGDNRRYTVVEHQLDNNNKYVRKEYSGIRCMFHQIPKTVTPGYCEKIYFVTIKERTNKFKPNNSFESCTGNYLSKRKYIKMSMKSYLPDTKDNVEKNVERLLALESSELGQLVDDNTAYHLVVLVDQLCQYYGYGVGIIIGEEKTGYHFQKIVFNILI